MCEERWHEGGAFVWDYCYIVMVHGTGGDPDLCVRRDCMRVGHLSGTINGTQYRRGS